MDLTFLLTSLNKISIFAFIITFAILLYEVYLLKKDKSKKLMPSVPEFDTKKLVIANAPTIHNVPNILEGKKFNIFIIIAPVVFLVVFIITYLLSFAFLTKDKDTPITDITSVYSQGVLMFDENWQKLKDEDIQKVKPGDKIIIGIDKVNNFDIDMARIKINEKEWALEHTTLNYDKDYNVYYQEYQISSNESQLKIDAQLHSKTYGWLGK